MTVALVLLVLLVALFLGGCMTSPRVLFEDRLTAQAAHVRSRIEAHELEASREMRGCYKATLTIQRLIQERYPPMRDLEVFAEEFRELCWGWL
ncbi:hypothetical protein LCGC14_1319290 [marine sediment metagenome]|uniref:Uncharacterized protein n=1 Tax=marine sediment metagenome TaxID=412755 RepID=A0A0F9N0S4_9ZZZZ